MRVTKIIFDIDGTLVLLPIDWSRVIARIRDEENVSTSTFLGFIAKYHGTEVFWRIHRFLEDLEIDAANKLIVLDNSDEILKKLCKRIDIGFITMQSRSAAKKILSNLGIDKCENNLGILSTREDAATRVEQLAKALKVLNVGPKEVLFIGDKVLDAIASIINGVNVVVILRNLVSKRITDTDYIDEDLEVLGVQIAHNLVEAIQIAKRIYKIPME
ncbi:MAG: NIF family HAD-type phosphatase [Ignisphaera sp.]